MSSKDFDLDDLLNSALDELESQEKEKPTPKPINNTSPTSINNVNKIPTTTTTTTTNNNNNSNNTGNPFDMGKLGLQIEELLKSNEFANLLGGGFSNNNDSNKNSGTEGLDDPKLDDNMTEEEKKEFTDAMNKFQDLMKDFGGGEGGSTGFDPLSFINSMSQQQQQPTIPQQPQTQPNIDINDFEKHVSESLKGLAENASKQTPGNENDMLNSLFSMFSASNGGEGDDQVDSFFEESISYISTNYPSWIEKNKDKYSEEDYNRFKKQSEIFLILFKNNNNDQENQGLLEQMSELGSLPEAFCDEYLNKLEQQFNVDENTPK